MDGVTDDAPKLNAFLNTASSTHPVELFIDGICAVSRLTLPLGGYCTISGIGPIPGTGLIQPPNSNKTCIYGGPVGLDTNLDPGGTAPPISGQAIAIRNLWIDQQKAFQTGYNFAIDLIGYFGIHIENVTVYRSVKYGIRIGNIGVASFRRVHCIPFGYYGTISSDNTDGIHINGPAADVTISDCYFRTGDDAIALNAPEGYGGDIDGVVITNCDTNGSLSGVRIYNQNKTKEVEVRNVLISNCCIKATTAGFLLGFGYDNGSDSYGPTNPNGLKNITISNCQITSGGFIYWSTNIGNLKLIGNTWSMAIRHSTFGTPFALITIYSKTQGVRINGLEVASMTFVRNPAYSGANALVDLQSPFFPSPNSPAVIQGMVLNGFSVTYLGIEKPTSSLPVYLLNNNANNSTTSPTVKDCVISAQSPIFLTNVLAPPTVGGQGSLVTTFAATSIYGNLIGMVGIPDSIAGNGCFYFSTDQNTACIKIGSTAHPL